MIGLEGRTLRSARLTYRLLREADKSNLRALLSDPAVTAPGGFMPARTDADFDRFFEELTAYDTGVAILLGETLIGYIHVRRERLEAAPYADKRCAGFGFVIGKAYHNRGFGTEALATLTEYVRPRVDLCVCDHFEENEASKRVIQKCGYRYFETYTMHFDELGADKTCLSYIY